MKRMIMAGLFAASALAVPSAHAATVVVQGTVDAFGVDYISFSHAGGALNIFTTGVSNGPSFTQLFDPMVRLFKNNGSALGALTGTQVGVSDDGWFTFDPTLNYNPLAAGSYILAIGRSYLTENEARSGNASGPLWNQDYKTTFTSGTAVTIGNAVPEPATWAMMIAGFGMVGAGMRRRAPKVTVTYA